MIPFTENCYKTLSGFGVYIFYHNNLPLYVGQTNDFKRRISQHYTEAFKNNSSRPFYEYIRKYKEEITFEILQTEKREEEEKRLIQELSPQFNIVGAIGNTIDWLEKYEGKEFFVEDFDERDEIEILRAARNILSPLGFALFFELMFYERKFVFDKMKIIHSTRLTPKEISLAMEELEKKEFIDDNIFHLESSYHTEKLVRKLTEEEKIIKKEKKEQQRKEGFEKLIEEYVGKPLIPEIKDELVFRSKEFIRDTDGTTNFTIKLVLDKARELGYETKTHKVSKKDGLPKEYYLKTIRIILPKTSYIKT